MAERVVAVCTITCIFSLFKGSLVALEARSYMAERIALRATICLRSSVGDAVATASPSYAFGAAIVICYPRLAVALAERVAANTTTQCTALQ